MAELTEMLRANEAAIVSGAPLREVNRTADEHILPEGSYSVGQTRRFSPSACVMIAFYHASADHLTKAKRAQVINQVEGRLRDLTMGTLRKRLTENWNLKDGFVTVDFAPFMEDAVARFEQLRQATEMVTTSPDVMSGATVIRGTRVPVHDVGASVKAGFPIERIRKAYPSLSDEQIRLASLYTDAHPPRGRPRVQSRPTDIQVSERRLKRNAIG